MTSLNNRFSQWLALSTFALSSAVLFAQSADAPSQRTDDVISLSEFNVTSDKANGYLASESTTGTRIASKLSELPFAVNVVTSDFINDFAAFSLNDQLAYVSSFSPSEVTGQYQLRGFSAPTSLVNGFRRVGLIDTVDIERIEIIKGPAASIYGAIQPGGVVNILTRKPSTTPVNGLELGIGSQGFLRAAAYSSGPVGASTKLFYRVDVADQTTKFGEDFSSRRQAFISAQLLYKLNANTSVSIALEHSDTYEHPLQQLMTVSKKIFGPYTNVAYSQYFGLYTSAYNYNPSGPQSYDHNRLDSATATIEHRFNSVWSVRAAANVFKNPYNDNISSSGVYYPYGIGTVTASTPFTPLVKSTPQYDFKPQKGGGSQIDTLASFDTGSVGHKLLFTADYYDLSQRVLTLQSPTTYYDPANPYTASGYNYVKYADNSSLYSTTSQNYWTASDDYGLFASERASFFKGRIIALVSGRYDYVHNQVENYYFQDPATAQFSRKNTSYNTHAWTHALGLTAKITDTVSAYVNQSSAFNPQSQLDQNANPLPNNTSKGYEYGIKAGLFNQQFNVTLARFVISQYNLAVSETDPTTNLKQVLLTGEQQAKGYEADFNWQITNGLQLLGGYGYVDA
ncbi:MAG TPA: TonB-dependent receptor plug domain-containing protein, partial [Opitutaceae bacterium]|nr:TonB-dependent receptor plug domain-containing protein [Opitutaceae bacterium]